MGFSEVVIALLALSGFGVTQNPNAPTAQEVMKYAPDNADVMVYLDAEAVLPGNMKLLEGLPKDPAVAKSKELTQAVKQLIDQSNAGRQKVKSEIGIDPVTDVKSAAAWIIISQKGEPTFIAAVRGNFPADIIDNIAKKEPEDKVETVGKIKMLIDKDDPVAIARASDGVLLVGTPTLVKQRLGKWNPKKAKKGSLGERAGALVDQKPFLLVASAPGVAAQKRADAALGRDKDAAVLLDFYKGHEFSAVWLSWNGLGWTYRAREQKGYERAVMGSEGAIDLLRASHLLVRGGAKVVLAVIDSYTSNPEVAQIAKHKAEILKLVEAWSGDGQFNAKVDKNAKLRTVTVNATGNKLSDVISVGAVALPAVLFMTRAGKREEKGPATVKPREKKPEKQLTPDI